MLERVDRVQLVVRDRSRAASTFAAILGTEIARESDSAPLGARRTILALGESELELCEPSGPGPARAHLDRFGEGLIGAGFSVDDMRAMRGQLARAGARFVEDGDQTYIAADQTFGMPVVITPASRRRRVGPVSFLYEVTNTLTTGWTVVADRYAAMFGLDPTRFSPIKSDRFGYVGTLTLFDPPARLDRIELSQAVNPGTAMGRWAARRGDSLYMCYIEAHDVPDIVRRLRAAGMRYTPRGGDAATERDGLWIHPGDFHGLLLGVSRTTLAWEWSGRPALLRPA